MTGLFCLKQTFLRQKVTLESPGSPAAMSKLQEDLNLKVKDLSISQSNHPAKTESTSSMQGNGIKCMPGEGVSPSVKYQNGPAYGEFSEKGRCICDDICHRTERQPPASCLKANKNMAGAGALRYALHLRFLCPFPKKGSRSVNGKEVDRRFYLYNDLRVVFPQRHSDADEGKVCSRYSLKIIINAVSLSLFTTLQQAFEIQPWVDTIGIWSECCCSSSLQLC